MTIWTSKGLLAALALAALAACEDTQGGGLLAGLSAPAQNVALSQASMAFGAVTLVPPRGFCIDRNSLQQRFALMARCDQLGVPSAAADAPLGLITASFAPAGREAALPDANQMAAALNLANPSQPVVTDTSVLFRAEGPVPSTGLGNIQWRGAALIGTQLVGLALYSPPDGRATGQQGRAILTELIKAAKPVPDS